MRISAVAVVMAGVLGLGVSAQAQVVGSFTWQTQPFCNRVTLTITQQGGVYQLTGVDDQCGAFSAPVYGTAVATSTGINMGFSAAFGTGRTSHLTAVVSLATVSGTWADGDGNTGTFAFNGAASGSARPGPAAFFSLATIPSGVTVTGDYLYDSHQPATPSSTDRFLMSLPGLAPVPLTDAQVNLALPGTADYDATCTGTVSAPTAPRGKVCIYAGGRGGFQVSSASATASSLASRSFFVDFTPQSGGGDVFFYVTWAYTAP